MAIAVSGKAFKAPKGSLRVQCTGGDSLFEINQNGIGWSPVSGGDIVAGVVPDGTVFMTEDLSEYGADDNSTQLRFTGSGIVSYVTGK